MKTFFDKKRKDPYPSKIDDYSEKQIKELGKTWKNYEKLSEGEKKAVQEEKTYQSFQKLLTALGEKYHELGWTMEVHIGAKRNNNTHMFN